MDTETLDLLRSTVRALLADPPGDLAAALDDLGWSEVVAEDPVASYTTLFMLQGELGAATAALDGVVAAALGLDPGVRVVWPWPAGPGTLGVVLAELPAGAKVVVPAGGGVLHVDPATLALRPVDGIDTDARWFVVEGAVPEGRPQGDWPAALAAARRALATELVGNGRRCLGMATEHVRSRVQFGRPIGSFQAVRHRLAAAHASLAGAEALAGAAWQAGQGAATVAKAAAGSAAQEAATAAMQVCGGMGLSEEHPLPAAVRRGLVIDGLLGAVPTLHRAIGWELLGGRAPEPVGEF